MTPAQIRHSVKSAGSIMIALENIAALRDAGRIAGAEFPVRWSFEPDTPATVIQYLNAGAHGAATGAMVGLGLEFVVGALFPAATFGFLVVGGALVGATHGAGRVEEGWRIRFIEAHDGRQLLQVRQAA